MYTQLINPQSQAQMQKVPFSKQSPFEQVDQIIESLPADIRFIKVFPFNKLSSSNQQKPPHVLTFEDNDEIFIEDLIKKYASEVGKNAEAKKMNFKLAGGYVMNKEKTIRQIKKQLRIDTLDGVEVYIQILNELLFYIDQCNIETLVEAEACYNKNAAEVEFMLPNIKYSVYLPLQGNQNVGKKTIKPSPQEEKKKAIELFRQVVRKLSAEIQRIFGVNIDPSFIALAYYQSKQGVWVNNQRISFKKLFKTDKVKVTFKNNMVLPAPPRQNNTFLIIQGQGIKQNKLHYDDIKNKKLKDLLNQIEPRPTWHEYGLKIGDLVLKPEEKFSKADNLMKNSTQNWKSLSGVLINQAQMFEAQQKRIQTLAKFDLEKVIDTKKTNLQLRLTCDKMIVERAKTANHVYFKGKIQNILPIFIYTSELQVKASERGNSAALYRNLNAFLRKQSFGQTTEDHYKQMWQYAFTNNLLQQLSKIPPFKNRILYRGVSYMPIHKVGDIILYKQFNSTTPIENKAKQFAGYALFKITKSYSGKSIRDFSYFQAEEEVLFQPYCQFKVTKVSETVNQMMAGILIRLIEMEQIQKAPMPDSSAVFVLWVDDKTKEVKQTWEALTNIKKNSVMVPLLSTEELKNWLIKNKTLLEDVTADFVVITNMTRMQKGVKNDYAGVQAIKQFKKYKPESNIFVYIGWVEGTNQKLKQHGLLYPNNYIEVSNNPDHLQKFLKAYAGVS